VKIGKLDLVLEKYPVMTAVSNTPSVGPS